MKKAWMLALILGVLGANAQTVRVRNQTVDLAPVVQWLQTREGERPMPHWKVVQIQSLVRDAWGGQQVAANIEGENRQIVIQNLPREVATAFERERTLLEEMAGMEQRMDQIGRQNLEIDRVLELTVRDLSNAYEIHRAMRLANDQLLRELDLTHQRLAEQLKRTTALKDSQLLAFFTGQTVSGGLKLGQLEVWDCGIGARPLVKTPPPG
jgi:hypothetical protein